MTSVSSIGAGSLLYRRSAPASEQEDTALQQAREALSTLKRTSQQTQQDREAAAEEKLERIKEELRMLIQFGFPPEVIARRLAQLGKELGAAICQHADGAAMQAGAQVAAAGTVADTVATDGASQTGTVETDGAFAQAREGASADDRQDGRPPLGYGETADLARDRTRAAGSDRNIADEFKSLAARIKAMMREAEEDMERQNKTTAGFQDGSAGIDAALSLLEGTAGNAAGSTLSASTALTL